MQELCEAFRVEYPLRHSFNIARGNKTSAQTVVVRLTDGEHVGWGEAVPYGRYGESLDSVLEQIGAIDTRQLTQERLYTELPAGSARNALDLALWDLAAKREGVPVWTLLGQTASRPLVCTHTTISLDDADKMADAARGLEGILKIKLGRSEGDEERLQAVRAAAPSARLIVDVNEGWSAEQLKRYAPVITACAVEVLEQPLKAGEDAALRQRRDFLSCPVIADESIHTREDLPSMAPFYDGINIKLDKTGGLTEALAMLQIAQSMNLKIMVGCMVTGSLGILPASLLAQDADWADLDGPRLVREDCEPSVRFNGDYLEWPAAPLWGEAQNAAITFPRP